MKKSSKFIILVGPIVFVIIVAYIVVFSSGYKIGITNNTENIITDLELKYEVGGSTIQIISQIEPKKSWKNTIDTTTFQGENLINLKYKDINGNYHEKCIVPYLENGYRGKVDVFINKIDKNGHLEIEVSLL